MNTRDKFLERLAQNVEDYVLQYCYTNNITINEHTATQCEDVAFWYLYDRNLDTQYRYMIDLQQQCGKLLVLV
jgi:hypothetical protein